MVCTTWSEYVNFFRQHSETQPNPGATAADIDAAEERLGFHLPKQYVELLHAVNGWELFNKSETLFGTEVIGTNDEHWLSARHELEESIGMFGDKSMSDPDRYDIKPSASTEYPLRNHMIPLFNSPYSYNIVAAGGYANGESPVLTIFQYMSGNTRTYVDLHEFLDREVAMLT